MCKHLKGLKNIELEGIELEDILNFNLASKEVLSRASFQLQMLWKPLWQGMRPMACGSLVGGEGSSRNFLTLPQTRLRAGDRALCEADRAVPIPSGVRVRLQGEGAPRRGHADQRHDNFSEPTPTTMQR